MPLHSAIPLRFTSESVENFDKIADLFTEKEGRPVTRAHVIRRAIEYGLPFVAKELSDVSVPGLTIVKPSPTLKDVAALLRKIFEAGCRQIVDDQPQPSPSQS